MNFELEHGQYYLDVFNRFVLFFEEKVGDFYWFYCPTLNQNVGYYEEELKNLRRY